jgi:PKD repeat protein
VPSGQYKTIVSRGLAVTGNGVVLYEADPTYGSAPANYQLGIIGKSSLTVTAPNARFTSAQQLVPGMSVDFDGSVSEAYFANGSIVGWSWNFGDGATATGSKPSHAFAAPGAYLVKLTVTDDKGATDDFTATVKVSNPPVDNAGSLTVNEDNAGSVTLSAADPNNFPLTYAVVTPPAHGSLTQNGKQITYTPADNYFGTDSFTWKSNDGYVDGNVATISITVAPVNDAPTAVADVLPIAPSGQATLINPLANDYDVENDNFSITSFTQPTRGTVTLAGATFSYTPSKSYQGFDNFTYVITDAHGAASTGTVSVASGVAVLDGDWTTFGDSAARTGYFPGFVGTATPITGWSLAAGSANNPAIIAQGRLYLTSSDQAGLYLRAYDAASGAPLWTQTFPAGFSINPPTYYNGQIFLQRSNNGGSTQLYDVNAADGKLLWTTPFGSQWEHYYAPAVSDLGIWIDGGTYGGMYGFRFDGSQIAFVSQAQVDGWAPAILGNAIYAQVNGNFSKYAANGSLQWTNAHGGSWYGGSMNRVPALSAADNRAFMNGSAELYSVNLADGTLAWSVSGSFAGSPAVAGGAVFALLGNSVKSYGTADGTLLKTYATDSAPIEQPIITNDVVIAASASKTYLFDKASATLLQTIPFGGRISLANNRLYVVSGDGSVHTYNFARQDNNWPTATPDAGSTAEDTAADFVVAANDTDPDGDSLLVSAVSVAQHGATSLNAIGSIH